MPRYAGCRPSYSRPQPPRPSPRVIQRVLARQARDTPAPRPPTRHGVKQEHVNKIRDTIERAVKITTGINNLTDTIPSPLDSQDATADHSTKPAQGSIIDSDESRDECLSERNTKSTYVYANLDSGGRAQGAVACLAPWVETRLDGYPPDVPGRRESDDRSHLIARQFGGHAIKENIVPMGRTINQFHGVGSMHMPDVEKMVHDELADNRRVYYSVIPRYLSRGPRTARPIGVDVRIYSRQFEWEGHVANTP